MRLKEALKSVKNEISANQPITTSANDGIAKRFFTSVGNEFKNSKLTRLYSREANIKRELQHCINNTKDYKIYENLEDIREVLNAVFSNDIYDLEKSLFSISIIFDGEYNYDYEATGLSIISNLIWGNHYRLSSMKTDIEANYKSLAKQPLSTEQKIVLGGTAALLLFTTTVPALAIGGLSASGITGGLAGFGAALGIGGSMTAGVGLMITAEILLDCALIGFTYKLLDTHNKNQVKKSFREMNFNNAAQMLAIKCYIMKIAKEKMPKSLFKEKMSELLQMVSDLKSDTDYVLLVEEENTTENKKKINVFHNLDYKLSSMFCS